MSSLYEKQRQYALEHKEPADASSWDQMCGSLMYRFNSWLGWGKHPTPDISSAYRVAMRSGWLNPDAGKAPVGAWHYFSIAGEANGHVMQDGLAGGHTCLSTGWDLNESLGRAIGFTSPWAYVAAKNGRAKYLGWSLRYADGTINPNYSGSTAGGGESPKPLPVPEPAPTPKPEVPKALEFSMARTYIARINADGTDYNEWMLAGVDIPPLNPNGTHLEKLQDGYRVTTDKSVALVWANLYSPRPPIPNARLVGGAPDSDYRKVQDMARAQAAEWRAGIQALLK